MFKCIKCNKDDPCFFLQKGPESPSCCPLTPDNKSDWKYVEEPLLVDMLVKAVDK